MLLYNTYDNLPNDIWFEYCHVRDIANRYMANKIANLLIQDYLQKYKKGINNEKI